MPPFPSEALSRFVQFRLTTSPSPRRVPKQLHRAKCREGMPTRPHQTSSLRRATPSPKTTDQYQLGALAHAYTAVASGSELTDPPISKVTLVPARMPALRTLDDCLAFAAALKNRVHLGSPPPANRTNPIRKCAKPGPGPDGRGPSSARLPTTITARLDRGLKHSLPACRVCDCTSRPASRYLSAEKPADDHLRPIAVTFRPTFAGFENASWLAN